MRRDSVKDLLCDNNRNLNLPSAQRFYFSPPFLPTHTKRPGVSPPPTTTTTTLLRFWPRLGTLRRWEGAKKKEEEKEKSGPFVASDVLLIL